MEKGGFHFMYTFCGFIDLISSTHACFIHFLLFKIAFICSAFLFCPVPFRSVEFAYTLVRWQILLNSWFPFGLLVDTFYIPHKCTFYDAILLQAFLVRFNMSIQRTMNLSIYQESFGRLLIDVDEAKYFVDMDIR